jgi:hypothetical protein
MDRIDRIYKIYMTKSMSRISQRAACFLATKLPNRFLVHLVNLVNPV